MKGRALLVLAVAAMIPATRLTGQFYSTGEPPATIHWNKITTPHFRIVFPRGLASDAGRMASQLEHYFSLGMDDLQHPMRRKFPVLLHSSSVIPNGYVTLAPRRMEGVVTPPQDSYAQDWITQLTLHEFRHVAQVNLLDQGFTGALSWLTGEIARGSISSQIPLWLYEGDAVYNETRLSESGRGRVPGFEMPLRTLLLENPRGYSYDKAVFGSYRNYVPDHYRFGYPMVCFARSVYGKKVWSEAIRYTARHPFLIWPMAFHLRKQYGVYKSDLYNQTMDSLKQQYNKEKEEITCIEYLSIVRRDNRIYTNYLLPKDLGNRRVLALRTGLGDPGSFVTIDSAGNVRKILTTGATNGLKCDIHGNRLVWDEVVSDPRWKRRDFSIIRVVDLNTGRSQPVTHHSRYFSPDFSPDGSLIAVTENDLMNRNFVVALNASTGACLYRMATPHNRAAQTPEWTSENEIVVVTVSEEGKQLERVNIKTGAWSVVIPFTRVDIADPVSYGEFILFRGSHQGIENIYAVGKSGSGQWYQLTASTYGAYHPSVSRDSLSLLFSNYGPNGFDVASIPIDTGLWLKVPIREPAPPRWNNVLNSDQDAPDDNPEQTYPITNYSKATHLFNIHSWLPFYTDVGKLRDDLGDATFYPGLMLYSQNLLSTLTSSLGYSYERGYHRFMPSILWRGWYPAMELSATIGGPQLALPMPEGIELPNSVSPYYEVHLKTFIPLVFNRKSYIIQIIPSVEYEQSGIWYYSGDRLRKGLDFLHLKTGIINYQRYAPRDLYPRWAQSFNVSYTQTPIEDGQFGDMLSVRAAAYFPGLFAHHHFHVSTGTQVQRPEMFFIPLNRIDFPRGYEASVSRQLTTLRTNYSFPVWYPDLSIGPLLYLKRFRVNLFYDWSYGKDIKEIHGGELKDFTGSHRSFGTEIVADMHIIRIIFPFSVGLRLGYLPGEENGFTELILGMDTGIF